MSCGCNKPAAPVTGGCGCQQSQNTGADATPGNAWVPIAILGVAALIGAASLWQAAKK